MADYDWNSIRFQLQSGWTLSPGRLLSDFDWNLGQFWPSRYGRWWLKFDQILAIIQPKFSRYYVVLQPLGFIGSNWFIMPLTIMNHRRKQRWWITSGSDDSKSCRNEVRRRTSLFSYINIKLKYSIEYKCACVTNYCAKNMNSDVVMK